MPLLWESLGLRSGSLMGGLVLRLVKLCLFAFVLLALPALPVRAIDLDASGRLIDADGFVLLGEDMKGNLMYAKQFKKQSGDLLRVLVKWERVDGSVRFENAFWDCKGARYRFSTSSKWKKVNPNKMYDYVYQFTCK